MAVAIEKRKYFIIKFVVSLIIIVYEHTAICQKSVVS
jgi:hypothetical protein